MATPLNLTEKGPEIADDDARRLATSVFVAWMVVVVSAFWFAFAVFLGYPLMSVASLIVGFGGVGCIVLAKLGYSTLAKSTLLAFSNIGVFLGTFVAHSNANIFFIYATFIGAPFLYFSLKRELGYILFFGGTAILAGFSLSFIDVATVGLIEVNEHISSTIVAPMAWLTTVSFIFAEFAFFVIQSDRYQASLLEANAATQKAAKAKSDFLANMSHEIRTPMNGVVGMIEMLEHTKLDESQKDMTGTIRESSFALLRIVDDILDSSKIETGQLTLVKAPTDLRVEVKSVLQTVSETARKGNVKISVDVRPDTPQWVEVDSGRLKQILLNIVSNAIKFSSKKEKEGKVRINVWQGKSGGIRFLISDDGVGMGPDLKRKIFLPFTQSEEHSKRKYGGTGLGLSIVQKLVTLMNGTVQVRSSVGNGAAFLVSLPLAECAAPISAENLKPAIASADVSDDTSLESKRVLLVEDNVINQKVIQAQLEQIGYRVAVAQNGSEGFDIWKDGMFDIVLSDCHMPVMDGFEMTAAIRSAEDFDGRSRTPVIAITANALAGEAERCKAAGMDDYLSKPVRIDELSQALERCADEHRKVM